MGEAPKEEAKAEGAPEGEKKDGKADEKKPEEEKPPSPPPPVILFVNLHCVGCARKIERCIMKQRGVEAVQMDMASNQVTIKGVVNPQELCAKIQKRAMRQAEVLSPPPMPDGAGEEQGAADQLVASQVSGITTVELNVNMHCEACAQQLRRKILKMRGVQTAETELSSGKVTVTGTMDADTLVEYVYRRTRKQAKVVPQPPPPPPVDEEKQEDEKPAATEEKKDESPPEGEKKEEESKEGADKAEGGEKLAAADDGGKDEKPAEGGESDGGGGQGEEKGGGGGQPSGTVEGIPFVEDNLKKMMYGWAPVYVFERPPPPPQLFSEENPNACCIS